MSDWKEYQLKDVIEKFIDYRGKTPTKVEKGIPLITAKVIKDGSILTPDEFIQECEYSSWMTRGFPKKNDVLLTTEAPLGEVAMISDENIALAQRIILLRGKRELLVNHFLFYSLRTGLMQYRLKARASGSTVQGIKSSELKEVLIPLPNVEEQGRIADVLSCLDAKIENLRRQNETLEQIARSLFKHWFIDFEFPNVDGKPYKSSGGAMFTSELGEIPEGWRVGKLGDIGKNIREGVKENDIKPDMSYIGLEHIPRKQIALDTWVKALDIASNKFWFNKGNILFGKLRPYFHKVGVSFTSGVCSTDILVIDSKQETYFGFLLMLLSSEQFIYYVSLASEGTRMPRTSWEYRTHLGSIDLLIS